MGDFWKRVVLFAVIVISNKGFPPDSMKTRRQTEPLMEPNVVNTYEMLATDSLNMRRLGNVDFKAILIMLENFKKDLDNLTEPEDYWFCALKDPELSSGKSKMSQFRSIESLEKASGGNDALSRFYAKLNKSNIGDVAAYLSRIDQHEQYDESLKSEGRAEGRAEGREEMMKSMARKLLKRSYSSVDKAIEAMKDMLDDPHKEEIRNVISRIQAESA